MRVYTVNKLIIEISEAFKLLLRFMVHACCLHNCLHTYMYIIYALHHQLKEEFETDTDSPSHSLVEDRSFDGQAFH